MIFTNHPVADYRSVVDDSTQFLDVRTAGEVASGSLPGAVNIPLGELAGRVVDLDPNRRVVLLCHSGGRSARAAEFLGGAGFNDIINLEGGMLAYGGAQ